MQAIIVTGGKQYKVEEGSSLFIEKLDAQPDETVTFDKVLAVVDGDNVVIGGNAFLTSSVEADTTVSIVKPEMRFRGKKSKE